MDIRFEKREHLQEKPDQKNLGFGKHFTDYMFVMDWDKEQGWHDAAIVPYGGIPMDPATMVLHYAQETFEGMKAYRTAEGKADGTVYRYTCQVGGKICHLTYEEKDRRSETAIRS